MTMTAQNKGWRSQASFQNKWYNTIFTWKTNPAGPYTACSESRDGLCALWGTQEPGEGVFGHQTVDPLLCLIEPVRTHRVHRLQQGFPGLGVQVHLRKGWGSRFRPRRATPGSMAFTSHPGTDLLRCVGVDELTIDAAGFGLWGRAPVVLTGQPELEVLLAELWAQEPAKCLKTTWGGECKRCVGKKGLGSSEVWEVPGCE